ncbi:phytanoyl-CoA dioxygenase family protein [Pseudobacter ginsenosidimutans]|uniref:Ectoine hydroxylase-related dioxygenase (Phytanoyl-CoA dioxygenase family) n=1 Tax=Pseudobacter ginsenosidimutans TaxID=661488 RepID=A0A4Q7N2Y7_9BACT|nr:phytanoyl-CoA dioxygenase family protein [Pseudobacter ginsenosidimutans]RZS74428.1 ectoine hydroxylase-related dioxygenase (phytanoyl-CoA dioxygenase family) [Pseudobacter ginsenosidimutans]
MDKINIPASNNLSPETLRNIREAYDIHGYYVLRNVFTEAEMELLKQEIKRLCRQHPELITFENAVDGSNRKVMHKISNFLECSPALMGTAQSPYFLSVVAAIFGEEAILCTDKINFKQPGGRGFLPHQDMSGIWQKYMTNIISIFISCENATVENGCLEIAPGEHKKGIMSEYMQPIEAAAAQALPFEKLETLPGDVIVFDGFAPHQSAPNFSAMGRSAILFTYNKAAEGNFRPQFMKDFGLPGSGAAQKM